MVGCRSKGVYLPPHPQFSKYSKEGIQPVYIHSLRPRLLYFHIHFSKVDDSTDVLIRLTESTKSFEFER